MAASLLAAWLVAFRYITTLILLRSTTQLQRDVACDATILYTALIVSTTKFNFFNIFA